MTNRLLENSTIALALDKDRDELIRIHADAFHDDPMMMHGAGKPGFAGTMFALDYDYAYQHYGHSYILRDEEGEALGGTMWAGPGQYDESRSLAYTIKLAAAILVGCGFAGLRRFMAIGDWTSTHHIKEPHYYLYTIGVSKGAQGKGVGGALLAHTIAMADADHMPCYLESSKIENVPLYERHGFEVIEKQDAPFNGPPMWFMKRPAR